MSTNGQQRNPAVKVHTKNIKLNMLMYNTTPSLLSLPHLPPPANDRKVLNLLCYSSQKLKYYPTLCSGTSDILDSEWNRERRPTRTYYASKENTRSFMINDKREVLLHNLCECMRDDYCLEQMAERNFKNAKGLY